MNFEWNEEQLSYYHEVVAFAKTHLNDNLTERDSAGSFSHELWQKCADFGLLGLSVPKEYGGNRKDVMTAMLAMEALGYGCRDNGLALALNVQIWTTQLPIYQFGNEEQRQRYLPDLCVGKLISADGLTEPEAGSDIFNMKSTAEKVEGGYILNGNKCFITLAPIADLALVFASTAPDKGRWGFSAFIVERGTEGFSQPPVREKMGLRTVPMGDMILKDCFVPEENRLGKEGAGASILQSSLEWERCFILASQLGAMERQLEETIDYANERHQFKQSIGKFQSVSNRIADMKLRLETARLLLYKVAWLKSNNKPAMMEAALVKLYLSEAFFESSMDAVRIHGGKGYVSEYGIERDLRDAVGAVIYGGTSDIQRKIVARLLGL